MNKTKKGFVLTEILISTFIFSIIALLLFQLAAILIVKIKTNQVTMSKTSNLWVAQNIISRDIKTASQIKLIKNGFVLSNNNQDNISWVLSNGSLRRKLALSNSVAATGIIKFESILEDNMLFVCLETARDKINFCVKSRLF